MKVVSFNLPKYGLMLAAVAMSAAVTMPLRAQLWTPVLPAPDPSVPQAVTHQVWVGFDGCTATAPTTGGNYNCWWNGTAAVSATGSAQDISLGDSVNFDSVNNGNHDVTAGAASGTGVCGSSGGNSPDPAAMKWIETPNAVFTGINAYVFRFDKPGVYWYACAAHKGTQYYRIVVSPVTTPCTGGACQNPLLVFKKIAVGQTINTVCGFGTQTQGAQLPPGALAAGTVLCWYGNSSTPASPGAAHVFRDTLPTFNPATSLDYKELTSPTRATCSPNYTDNTPLPAGKSIFYYRICDNATCSDS